MWGLPIGYEDYDGPTSGFYFKMTYGCILVFRVLEFTEFSLGLRVQTWRLRLGRIRV